MWKLAIVVLSVAAVTAGDMSSTFPTTTTGSPTECDTVKPTLPATTDTSEVTFTTAQPTTTVRPTTAPQTSELTVTFSTTVAVSTTVTSPTSRPTSTITTDTIPTSTWAPTSTAEPTTPRPSSTSTWAPTSTPQPTTPRPTSTSTGAPTSTAEPTTPRPTSTITTTSPSTSTAVPSTTIDPNGVCRDVNIGVTPHPQNCYQYFVCLFDASKEVTCSDGHIFDTQSLNCVPGNRDTCTRSLRLAVKA